MKSSPENIRRRKGPKLLKLSLVAAFFLFSLLLVACGTTSAQTDENGKPLPTYTITFNQGDQPPNAPEYTCIGWASQTSVNVNNSVLGVNAKYTHNVNGNAEGIAGANATAYVTWPDGQVATYPTITTADGLAVFHVNIPASKAAYVNKLALVNITFTKAGTPGCKVEGNQAAFFTLVVGSPAAATNTATPNGKPDKSPTGIPEDPTATFTIPGIPWGTPSATSTHKPGGDN
jgi:hypothetical protein